MKHLSKVISAVIIIAVLLFLAIYVFGSKEVKAPDQASPATTVIPADNTNKDVKVTVASVKESDSATPTVTIEYPQFSNLPADFNAAISASVLGRLTDFRETVKENEEARSATAHGEAVIPLSAYSFTATWSPAQVNNKYVSLIMRYDSYAGGANGDIELETFNYDVGAKKIMDLTDLFPGKKDVLKQISVIVRKDLKASMDKASDGNAPTDMIAAGTEPVSENFSNFTFTDTTVTFYFPKYSVAPGSFGEQKDTISRSAVK